MDFVGACFMVVILWILVFGGGLRWFSFVVLILVLLFVWWLTVAFGL